LKPAGTLLLIHCSNDDVAKTLAEHKETSTLCQLVGKKQLLVKLSQEEKIYQAIHVVGYGMAL